MAGEATDGLQNSLYLVIIVTCVSIATFICSAFGRYCSKKVAQSRCQCCPFHQSPQPAPQRRFVPNLPRNTSNQTFGFPAQHSNPSRTTDSGTFRRLGIGEQRSYSGFARQLENQNLSPIRQTPTGSGLSVPMVRPSAPVRTESPEIQTEEIFRLAERGRNLSVNSPSDLITKSTQTADDQVQKSSFLQQRSLIGSRKSNPYDQIVYESEQPGVMANDEVVEVIVEEEPTMLKKFHSAEPQKALGRPYGSPGSTMPNNRSLFIRPPPFNISTADVLEDVNNNVNPATDHFEQKSFGHNVTENEQAISAVDERVNEDMAELEPLLAKKVPQQPLDASSKPHGSPGSTIPINKRLLLTPNPQFDLNDVDVFDDGHQTSDAKQFRLKPDRFRRKSDQFFLYGSGCCRHCGQDLPGKSKFGLKSDSCHHAKRLNSLPIVEHHEQPPVSPIVPIPSDTMFKIKPKPTTGHSPRRKVWEFETEPRMSPVNPLFYKLVTPSTAPSSTSQAASIPSSMWDHEGMEINPKLAVDVDPNLKSNDQ